MYGSTDYSPEQRLLSAVIQRAVQDYRAGETAYIRTNAEKWLWSDRRSLMSMWWVCRQLSDDPRGLREKILFGAKNVEAKPKAVIFRVDRR